MGLLDGIPPFPGRLISNNLALSNGDNNNIVVTTGLTSGLFPSYVTFLGLKHNDGGSSAGNQITIATGANISFTNVNGVRLHLIYDPSVGAGTGYWVLFSAVDSAGAH